MMSMSMTMMMMNASLGLVTGSTGHLRAEDWTLETPVTLAVPPVAYHLAHYNPVNPQRPHRCKAGGPGRQEP